MVLYIIYNSDLVDVAKETERTERTLAFVDDTSAKPHGAGQPCTGPTGAHRPTGHTGHTGTQVTTGDDRSLQYVQHVQYVNARVVILKREWSLRDLFAARAAYVGAGYLRHPAGENASGRFEAVNGRCGCWVLEASGSVNGRCGCWVLEASGSVSGQCQRVSGRSEARMIVLKREWSYSNVSGPIEAPVVLTIREVNARVVLLKLQVAYFRAGDPLEWWARASWECDEGNPI
ncbi:hypothetical protein BU15DRAFT_67220 [Melanogaster broomeanus]|nr:hypothetical protein BU15DRAFT_67220 [Melanogaster broomeanus]